MCKVKVNYVKCRNVRVVLPHTFLKVADEGLQNDFGGLK